MPLPLVKLGYLLLRQMGKHVATALKTRTSKSPRFRNFCYGLANWYHSRDVNAKLKLLGLGTSKEVQKLEPDRAVQLGTELMGEFIAYFIIAALVYAEYSYTSKGNEIKEQKRKEEWNGLERKMDDLFMITERQETELTELRRLVIHLEEKNRGLLEKFFGKEKKG